MKRTIEFLLQSIEAGAAGPKAHSPHAEKVRAAFDAGIFDSLTGHPGKEPPHDTRDVLCYDCEGFHLGFYAHDLGWWYFHIPGESSQPCYEIYQWWELPSPTEEPK